MTQVNKLLKVLVTTSMVLGSYACTDDKTVEEYQAEAQAFIQENDHKSAIIALKNANALDPSNAPLRFELGMLYLNQGDYLSAEKELERAESLGFDSVKVLPEIIEVKYKLLKFDDVYSLVDNASNLSDSGYIKALTYAGLSSLAEDEREKAVEYMDQANSITSESVYGQIGKAYLASSQKEIKEALALVNSLIAYAPEITESYLLKGYLLQNTKAYLEAADAFNQYAKLRPREVQIQFYIAQNYISAQVLEKAEPIVNRLLKQVGSHSLANQMKAQIAFQKKDYREAKTYGEKAYQINKNLILSAIISGMSAYYLEDYQQAYNLLVKVENSGVSKQNISRVLIELRLRLGYDTEAVESLNNLIENGNADSALLNTASNRLLAAGKKDEARELLQESIKLNSDDTTQIVNQGILKLKLNDLSGIELLEKALEIDPSSERAESSLAIGYLNNQQFEETLEIAKKWQLDENKKIQGLLLEAEINNKQGNKEETKEILNRVLVEDEKNIPALLRLATFSYQEKDTSTAFAYFKRIIDIDSSHVNATKGIIALSYDNKDIAKSAVEFYQQKIEESPKNSLLKLNLSYIYTAQKETDKSLALLKEMKASPSNTIEGVDLLIGDVYASKDDWETSLKYYLAITEKKPNSLKAAEKLYFNYAKLGLLKEALAEVKRIYAIYPDDQSLLLLKVNYESQLGIEVSNDELDTLRKNPKILSHWVFNSTLGNIALKNKELFLAEKYYQLAYDVEASSPNVIALSKVVARNKGVGISIALLKNHLSTVEQTDNSVQMMLANAYLISKKNYKMAESVYIDIIDSSPNNVIALNNLSFIYHEYNDSDQAMIFAKRAIQQAPDTPAIIDTYGQALLLNNEATLALKQFDKALALLPDNADININKAKALIQLGKQSEAKSILLNIEPTDEESQLIIKRLINEL